MTDKQVRMVWFCMLMAIFWGGPYFASTVDFRTVWYAFPALFTWVSCWFGCCIAMIEPLRWRDFL